MKANEYETREIKELILDNLGENKLQLYEACFGNERKSESAFFYAECDEQAENFAIIIKDEVGRKIMWIELADERVKPTHNYVLLKEMEEEIEIGGLK